MPKTKEQKKLILEKLKEKIAKQKAMIFVDFKGLKVEDLSKLRNELSQKDSQLMVEKKTLIKKALEENKIDSNPREMEGEIALVFGFKDELAPIKVIYGFSKKNNFLKILGGYINSQKQEFLNSEDIITLGQLPSRKELLANLLGTLTAPISGFENVLNGNIKGLLRVLSSIKN
ncbi:MAG: 50S ribosomal protein L10 [Patescibacteria group bacterium]|nr:50S ribosomal protein L10 [Patescibacteria group bacterium]MBU1877255.1 50S ribosomal protein L10 [Patescibacteria group bacterium]